MFDMEYPKSKAPSRPKPAGTAKRPVLGRKVRDTAKTSKVAMGCSFHDGLGVMARSLT